MNLFELFVKIGVDDQASKKIEKLSSKLGNGLKTAAKIGTAAVSAAAAGITALTAAAVKNYAEYEQLVGGVETLFKTSSDTVMKYAANAYKTAGMSANEYMSTATSFAASLINSFKDTSSEITAEMAEDMIASLDKQVDAFEEATDAQIKLINKQYMENMKLIDEEEYGRLKAVDDQIAAIEAEEKAEELAIKKRQQEEEKARLKKLIDAAADAESRQKAEQKLADYIQSLAEQERKQARKDQISALKDQKDAIKEEADIKRNALKEQHDYELEAYKEARDKELAYLKEHLKRQEKEIKASIGTMTEVVSLPAEAYEAAAKATDMAISDMADNAAKMGTSMELIQNAYSGFSKQNYMMLDNLKLGYGGTKTEMERLIADAAKLDDSVKANDMSFGNIVKAIHAVQVEMGIYGTTAKEAGRTISGSIGMMKAAWTNLITGISDKNADLEGLINNLVTSIVGDGTENNLGVLGNIMPAVKTALNGASKLIQGLLPQIVKEVPSIIKDNLPVLAEAAMSIIESLVDGISENQEMLMDTVVDTIVFLADGVLSMLPKIVQLGLDLIVSLANGITKSLPTLIPTIIDVVLQIVDTLTKPETLTNLLDAALVLLTELAYGLMDAIPNLVDACLTIIENIVLFLTNPENIGKLLQAAVEIILALAVGVVNAIPRLLEYFFGLPNKISEALFSADWGKIGEDIINGLWDGLKRMWSSLSKWFADSWDGLVGGVKDLLGIHSPSRVFAGIGKNMALGVGEGWEDEFGDIQDDIDKSLAFDDPSMSISASVRKIGAGSPGMAYGGTSIGNITINIDGASYSDEESLAEAVAQAIQDMTDRRSAVYA